MSRAIIGLVALVLMAAFTGAAVLVTTSNLEGRITRDVEGQVTRARELLLQNASLEGLGIMQTAERLARDPRLRTALATPETVARFEVADGAFRAFLGELQTDEPRPDFIVLIDRAGKVSAMHEVPRPDAEDWRDRFPAIAAALDRRQVSKDVWEYRKGVLKVGVAPVVDPATNEVAGAIAIAYALNAREAQAQAALLGMDVAWFHDGRVRATSFRRGGAEEDVARQEELRAPLFDGGLAARALAGEAPGIARVAIGGEEWLATAAPLPLNLADRTSGAVVMMSLTRALEPVAAVRNGILLLGLGGLIVALLAMIVTARLLLGPAEVIEAGVTEIINGNLDHTFRPVGKDLEGLANALNVMMARLLGRPEPGEEELDEHGDVPTRGRVTIDATDARAAQGGAPDPAMVALAQEPEADYYRRLHLEFLAASREVGASVDGITFEAFVAKVRLNEANLMQRYRCRAVRFRVQEKGGQISLKPVPIV